MKKVKVYRPRRGMRFANGRRGVLPPANFIGSGPISRSRPSIVKSNLVLRKFDSVQMSGSVMTFAKGPSNVYASPTDQTIITGSLYLEAAISTGRLYERKKLNSILLGLPSTSIDTAAWPSTAVIDVNAGQLQPTGTFASPSWTHASIGMNNAFVGLSLTSSYIETRTLNYFLSGTQALESSPVPASGNMFYSKQNRLQTIIVKHTASIFDTVIRNPPSGTYASRHFSSSYGAAISFVTGVGYSAGASVYTPLTIPISVPVNGNLVDIKVWIEIIQHGADNGRSGNWPLACLGIALRSPNVSFNNGHPVRNDPNFQKIPVGGYQYINPNDIANNGILDIVNPKFYVSSFVLWDPLTQMTNKNYGLQFASNVDTEMLNRNPQLLTGSFTSRYPVWSRDRSIRTIFSDSSAIANPRHIFKDIPVAMNYNGSPNGSNAWGNNIPWTTDATQLPTGLHTSAGSPPRGWLTGLGGVTASFNEWPTTGSNVGAETIRPIYPLLDPIYGRKNINSDPTQDYYELFSGTNAGTASLVEPSANAPWIFPANISYDVNTSLGIGNYYQDKDYILDQNKWNGFRPGLRGTQISGTWELLLVDSVRTDQGTTGSVPDTEKGISYFRQVRLEITYETNQPPINRRSYTSKQAIRNIEIKKDSISGSNAFIWPDGLQGGGVPSYFFPLMDGFQTDIYSAPPGNGCEIGRTFGMIMNTGSIGSQDFALLYRLSGVLAGISGSAPGWLLNNPFGMPAIPSNSASLSTPSAFVQSEEHPVSFMQPEKLLGGARRLVDVANDINPQQTLVQLASAFVSASTS